MTDDGRLDVQRDGIIGRLTLNRPEKSNTLTAAMWQAIPAAVAALAAEPRVRLIVLEGAGDSFSGGADLADVLDVARGHTTAVEYCGWVSRALTAITECSLPTVAVIRGAAAGGGAELALATDIRVMGESGRMLLPLAHLGVVPDRLTMRRLLALAGPGITRRLLFEGDVLPATQCLQARLVERVVPDRELPAAEAATVARLATTSSWAITEIKQALLEEEEIVALAGITTRMERALTTEHVAETARRFLSRTQTAPVESDR